MWLRTSMNYQYVNGGNLQNAIRYFVLAHELYSVSNTEKPIVAILLFVS